jgi:hypothetical protein
VEKSLGNIATDHRHAAKTCFNIDTVFGLYRVGKSICVFVPVVLCMLYVPTQILNTAVSAVKPENTLPHIYEEFSTIISLRRADFGCECSPE